MVCVIIGLNDAKALPKPMLTCVNKTVRNMIHWKFVQNTNIFIQGYL